MITKVKFIFGFISLLISIGAWASEDIRSEYFLTSELGKTIGNHRLVTSVIGGDQARVAYGFTEDLEARATLSWKTNTKRGDDAFGAVVTTKYHAWQFGIFHLGTLASIGPSKEASKKSVTNTTLLIPLSGKAARFIFSIGPRFKYAFERATSTLGGEAGVGVILGPPWGILAAEIKQDFNRKKATLYNAGIIFMPYPRVTVPFYFLTGTNTTGAQIGFQRFVVHLGFQL